MADGTVGVTQSGAPDRLIDNDLLTVGGASVYRQRVAAHAPIEETRLDYDVRTDGLPVYVGSALPATATSSAVWTVLKLTYDSSNRLTRKQARTNITWDARATGWPA